MNNNVIVKMSIAQDYTDITTEKGIPICRINRDDDSFEGAKKVLKALQFKVIEVEANEFIIANQDCICDECKKRYGDHPLSPAILSWEGEPFLHKLCDGTLVKL